MIKDIKDALALERGAPNREEVLTSVRQESNDWVAKYRRWALALSGNVNAEARLLTVTHVL